MTANEMIKAFNEMTEEERNLQVKFFNPEYEDYEKVTDIRFSKYNGKFILLNEA